MLLTKAKFTHLFQKRVSYNRTFVRFLKSHEYTRDILHIYEERNPWG
jgi:hypothetical protein